MNYSFFGTCFNDHTLLYGCIDSIISQTLKPKEIILIDSGDLNQESKIRSLIDTLDIKLIYVYKNLPRVKALNHAIKLSDSKYLIRFDTRTRFNKYYAENAINVLEESKGTKKFIGGIPRIIPEKKSFSASLCSGIMSRSYVFLYPRHRRKNYTGFASSVYLGCFESNLLKSNLYRDKNNLISEDSLLASDFRDLGYSPWIDKRLEIAYICRSSLINLGKLFNTYGLCRANTIISSKKLHSIRRYIFIILGFISYFFLFKDYILLLLIFFPITITLINCIGEILHSRYKFNIIYPILATLCQLIWLAGFLYGCIVSIRMNRQLTNYIK